MKVFGTESVLDLHIECNINVKSKDRLQNIWGSVSTKASGLTLWLLIGCSFLYPLPLCASVSPISSSTSLHLSLLLTLSITLPLLQDAFFYSLVYDPQQKTLLADKGEIRVGNKYQADITDFLKEGVGLFYEVMKHFIVWARRKMLQCRTIIRASARLYQFGSYLHEAG